MMSFLFTGDSGEVFEVASDDLSLPAPPHPYASFDSASAADPMSEAEYVSSAMRPFPLIMLTAVNDPPNDPVSPLRTKKAASRRKRSVSDQSGIGSGFEPPKVLFTYNDYGELVDVEKLKRPINSADLTVTETLRLILKAYHNKVFEITLMRAVGKEYANTIYVGSFAPTWDSWLLFN
jgi:hypothetical protein